MTWAAETPGASARRRSGIPRAAAGSAIIRASWPPPTTATTGASGWAWVTRDSVGGVVRSRATGSDSSRLGRPHGSRVAGRLDLEPQPVAADGGDQARLARVVAELAADPAEMDVDRLRRRPERGVPDGEHELVARDDSTRMLHEVMQEVELLAREHDLAIVAPYPAGGRIDADVLDSEHTMKIGTYHPSAPGNGPTRGPTKVKSRSRSLPRRRGERRPQWRRTATGSTRPKPRTGRAGSDRVSNWSSGSTSAVSRS